MSRNLLYVLSRSVRTPDLKTHLITENHFSVCLPDPSRKDFFWFVNFCCAPSIRFTLDGNSTCPCHGTNSSTCLRWGKITSFLNTLSIITCLNYKSQNKWNSVSCNKLQTVLHLEFIIDILSITRQVSLLSMYNKCDYIIPLLSLNKVKCTCT